MRPGRGLPRIADLLIAGLGLVLLSPLIVAAMVLIRLDSDPRSIASAASVGGSLASNRGARLGSAGGLPRERDQPPEPLCRGMCRWGQILPSPSASM